MHAFFSLVRAFFRYLGYITFIFYPIALFNLINADWDNDIAGFGALFHLVAIYISLFIVPVYLYVTFYLVRYATAFFLKKNLTTFKQSLKNAFVSLGVIGLCIPIALGEFLKVLLFIPVVLQLLSIPFSYLFERWILIGFMLGVPVLLAYFFYRSFKSFKVKTRWRPLKITLTLFFLALILLFVASYIDLYGFSF